MAQIVQSHALSFFHLSAPDLLLGMDYDPAKRNVAGLLAEHPAVVVDGVRLRKFGQQVIERLGRERIHPSWTVPGGVNAELDPAAREKTLEEWPDALAILQRTLELWKGTLDAFPEEVATFSNFPTMYCGTVSPAGALELYDGALRFRDAAGEIVADQIAAADYADYIGEATMSDSYLKAPFYKPLGLAEGIYRVGPLARLNVCDHISTPLAQAELQEMRDRLGRIVQSSFHTHYARLIEAVYAMERMQELLEDPKVLDTKVRAHAGVNDLEGVGIIEAPRGTLIHHYKVNEDGAMTWANLIVATGHNNLAIRRGVHDVATRFIDGNADPGGCGQPRLCPGACLRSLPLLLHAPDGSGGGGLDAPRARRPGPRREGHRLAVVPGVSEPSSGWPAPTEARCGAAARLAIHAPRA